LKRVAVIGAGVSGISFCYYLEKISTAPVEIRVYEKSNRIGGLVETIRTDGLIIDTGPDCFILEKPVPLEIAKELGFEGDVVHAVEETKGTYIYAGGRLHIMPEGLMTLVPTKFLPFATTGLFSFAGKLRMLLDLFLPRGNKEDETLAEFVRRRLGEEALNKLATPLVAGIYGSDPESMSLRATFPRFLEMEEKYRSLILGFLNQRKKMKKKKGSAENPRSYFLSFRYGMAELCEKMVESLKNTEFRFGTTVRKVDYSGGKYSVITDNGSNEYDAVVFAVPAHTAAVILPEELSMVSEKLSSYTYNSVATVNFVFDKRSFSAELKGHGFVVENKADISISAATFITNKWPERAPEDKHVIRVFVGGGSKSGLAEMEEEKITEIALKDLFKVLNSKPREPEEIYVRRFIKAMPQYDSGHLKRVEEIESVLKDMKGLFLTGSYLRGIGVPDCIKQGMMTAEKVKEFLNRLM
jgi:oxygen-dependent protoporphyrinogen oxidase